MTLSEQNLKDLQSFLLEIPAKYCNPILEFLVKIQQEQTPQPEEQV